MASKQSSKTPKTKPSGVAVLDHAAMLERHRVEPGKDYRVHFRNGHSAEVHGQALHNGAPINWPEVERFDEVGG